MIDEELTWSSYGGPGLNGALSRSKSSRLVRSLRVSSICFDLLGGLGGFGGRDLLWTTRMSLKIFESPLSLGGGLQLKVDMGSTFLKSALCPPPFL